MISSQALFALLCFLSAPPAEPLRAQEGLESASEAPLRLTRVLGIESLGQRGRMALFTDSLEAQRVRGAWPAPVEGGELASAEGEVRTWQTYEADEDGWITGSAMRGGWAQGRLEVPSAGSWRLRIEGASAVWVKGQAHYGDVYRLGITRVPLWIEEAGPLDLWVRTGRGSLRVTLEPAPAAVYFEELDPTLPDVVPSQVSNARLLNMAVLVSNATSQWIEGWRMRTTAGEGPPTDGYLPSLGPEAQRKVGMRVALFQVPDAEKVPVKLELFDEQGVLQHESSVDLRVKGDDQMHKRTFISKIDRSVQYYAVRAPSEEPTEETGLVLSLHGASVEASGQAAAYASKPDLWIVAPTNRRPYGFDWEDWGRRDALEVLSHAQRNMQHDRQRVYLSGHSMGGHGTWQLGVHFPDRFAVVAPCAGWRDFWRYGGAREWGEGDPVGALLTRSTLASRTLLLERNLLHSAVHVLHGDGDSTVPVSEARAMRERLAQYHPNFVYREVPGGGHWFGNRSVDWPGIFDLCRASRIPADHEVLEVEFESVRLTISNECYWVRMLSQETWGEPSRVKVRLKPAERRLELEASNLDSLLLDLRPFAQADPAVLAPGEPLTLVVGDTETRVEYPESGRLQLSQVVLISEGHWMAVAPDFDPARKGAHRAGPFREAFDRQMIFVVGTQGTPEENAWSYGKARFDAETWRYRANGQVELVTDVAFNERSVRERNVILYGNQDTNAAFASALGDDVPFELRNGRVVVGSYRAEGEDLGLLLCYPRAGTQEALVGIVGGTGLVGSRVTDNLPTFVSGVGYPDWIVLKPEVFLEGLEAVPAAGYFDEDWAPGGAGLEAIR